MNQRTHLDHSQATIVNVSGAAVLNRSYYKLLSIHSGLYTKLTYRFFVFEQDFQI